MSMLNELADVMLSSLIQSTEKLVKLIFGLGHKQSQQLVVSVVISPVTADAFFLSVVDHTAREEFVQKIRMLEIQLLQQKLVVLRNR